MAKNKKNGDEETWNEYLSSIEKPKKQAKKGHSIGETLKHLLESIGIGKEKKIGIEEVKEQVAISAEEGQKKASVESKEKPGVERRFGRWAVREKGTVSEGEAAKEFPEKKESPSSMERYLEKVEEKEREFEALAEKKAAEEKAKQEKPVVPKKVLPEATSQSFSAQAKKVLLLPAGGKKAVQIKEKVAMLPKAVKGLEEKGGEKAKKRPVWESRKPKKKGVLDGAKKAAEERGDAGKKQKKPEKIGEEEPGPSLAKKSVEEIKKLSAKQIKKELAEQRIEEKARGWYGDSIRHKKAAVSGWRLRKRVKLHQLKKKQKMKGLSENEKKAMKKLIAEDKEFRDRIARLDKQLWAFKKIASEKKKQNKELEKKIRATGIVFPEKEIQAVEGRGKRLKKAEMTQLVETMKKIADEMAATTARESIAGLESEEEMPIDDRIKTQEELIKNLEKSFYKRKIDFDQFREKMFDYQSKLTELKIRKKINDEKMKNLTPEMKQAIERRIAAGEVGKGVGIPSKTAEALEKIAAGKKEEKETGTEAIKAIKSIAEKQAKETEKKAKEKGRGEKTATILERIAEKLGSISRLGTDRSAIGAEKPEKEIAQQKPAMKASQGKGITEQPVASGKEKQGVQAQPGQEKRQAEQQAAAAQNIQAQAPSYQQPSQAGTQQQPYQKQAAAKEKAGKEEPAKKETRPYTATQMQASQGSGITEQPAASGKEMPRPQYPQTVYIAPRHRKMPLQPTKGMPRPAADFYEEEKPGKPKKGLFNGLRYKISGRPVSGHLVSEQVDRAIREKTVHSGISREEIDSIEEKLGRLLEKYSIPENIITSHIKALDESKLAQDFQKLMNLIEDKRENAADELSRLALDFDISAGITPKKREKIEAHEKEIRRTRIETSFDKVLALVQTNGAISLNEVANRLGMRKEEVQQCAEILERNRLINLNYPPIGSVKLIYPAYLKWKAEEKKKEAEKKKKQKKKK